MTPKIKTFINSLQPKDIGEHQIDNYIVAYEGFTNSCFDYLIENGLTIEETEKFLIEEWNKQFGIPIETGWRNEIVTYMEPNILYAIYKVNPKDNWQITATDETIGKFTEEDLDACWPYYKSYLVDILNGEYPVEAAREDLRSLIGSKWDERTK